MMLVSVNRIMLDYLLDLAFKEVIHQYLQESALIRKYY